MFPLIESLEKRRLLAAAGPAVLLHQMLPRISAIAGETSRPIRVEALDVHRHRVRDQVGDVTFELTFADGPPQLLGTAPLKNGVATWPGVNVTVSAPYLVVGTLPGLVRAEEPLDVVGARAVALSLESSLYVGQFETVRLRVLDQYGNFITSNSTVRIAGSDPASTGAFIQVHAYRGGRNVGLVMRHGKAVAVKILNGQCPMQLGTKATGDGQVTVHLAASDPHIAGIDLTFPFTAPGLT